MNFTGKMKKHIILIYILILAVGCETEPGPEEKLTDGFCIEFGFNNFLTHEEIEYYDYSTHLIYLKNPSEYLEKFESGIGFRVYAFEEMIYQGVILPGYSSFIPNRPVIHSEPFMYRDFVIGIDYFPELDNQNPLKPDPRKNDMIAEALKMYDQFRESLSATMDTIIFKNNHAITITLSLSNKDFVDYLFIDYEKTGTELFHYFTNGLTLVNIQTKETYTHHIDTQPPEPFDKWESDWLSVIEAGEAHTFSIHYEEFDSLPPGDYNIFFRFPGLKYQVSREDLQQPEGRIWLGEYNVIDSLYIEGPEIEED